MDFVLLLMPTYVVKFEVYSNGRDVVVSFRNVIARYLQREDSFACSKRTQNNKIYDFNKHTSRVMKFLYFGRSSSVDLIQMSQIVLGVVINFGILQLFANWLEVKTPKVFYLQVCANIFNSLLSLMVSYLFRFAVLANTNQNIPDWRQAELVFGQLFDDCSYRLKGSQ